MLTEALAIAFFVIGIQLMVPIVLAALGEAITEKSGVLNVGVEGVMLIGAFASVAGTVWTGDVWLGILIGILVNLVVSSAFWFVIVPLRATDHRPSRSAPFCRASCSQSAANAGACVALCEPFCARGTSTSSSTRSKGTP